MKKIEFNLSNLPIYRKKVIKNSKIEAEDYATLLDVISVFDQKYYNEIRQTLTENEKLRVLYIQPSKTLLHILWNPKNNLFYDDVYMEARQGFSDTTLIPVKDNIDMTLPDGIYIVGGPDYGC